MSAANAVLRLALAGGPPNVKPTAFLTIVAGVVGGPVAGFAVGFLSIAISDLATPLGAGFWTIADSAFMGLVGLLAGLMWYHVRSFKRWKLAVAGFILTVIFDVGTSIVDAFLFGSAWVVEVLGLYVPFFVGGFSGYPFGLVHELTTAILLASAGPTLIIRIRKVYG
jgi:energy-coupling factor transport system substrate-specific component